VAVPGQLSFCVLGPLEVRRQDGSPVDLGGPQARMLLARRLVEAGARFVMVDYGYDPEYGNLWDNHNAAVQNFPHVSELVKRDYHLAGVDRACAALLEDLDVRGLLGETLVVFLTEFGRTPKINKDAGRDHWARVNGALLAGGGMKVGQVIGSTDAIAGTAKDDPIPYPNVLATVYHNLGIDPQGMVYDVSDRPNPILPSTTQVIGKLV